MANSWRSEQGAFRGLPRTPWQASPKLDPIRDVQVIVGINRGETGRIAMNTELQTFMNPSANTGKYRVGDPVIGLKNDTYRVRTERNESSCRTAKSGTVRRLRRTSSSILEAKSRCVFPRNKSRLTSPTQSLATKCGVSETPLAIVFLDPSYQAKMVCTREWLYTAISRAKRVCYLIGDQLATEDYCRKLGNIRKTFLAEELRSATHDENTTSANIRP